MVLALGDQIYSTVAAVLSIMILLTALMFVMAQVFGKVGGAAKRGVN